MRNVLDAAKNMAARGYAVFPIRVSGPDEQGKKIVQPLCRWLYGEVPEIGTGSWAEANAYGIDCGKSGLTVIDLDVRDGNGLAEFEKLCAEHGQETLPETLIAETASGGRHIYFRGTVDKNSAKQISANIDIRTAGGMVIGPGSESFDGSAWRAVNHAEPAELPAWLRDLVTENPVSTGWREAQERYSGKSLNDLAEELASADKGGRNQTLNMVAFCAFMNPRIDDAEARERLTEAAVGSGLSKREIHKTLDSAQRAAGREGASQSPARASERQAGSLGITPLSEIPFRRVEWVWDTTADDEYEGSGGRFPIGTICIGAGRPGAGKGQFAAWLGARVSTGTLPGCFSGKPKGVIIYTTEDSHSMTIGPRFKAAGADLDRVFVFSRQTEQVGGFAVVKIHEDLPELRRIIEQYDIGLIILDPLISVLDGKTDINSETAVRSELEPFQAMLEEMRCFAFGIMHFRKMKDEDILNMFSGSGAFPRVVRAAVAFGAEKDDDGNLTRVISTVKNNLGRTDLPSYVYDFESVQVKTADGLSHVSRLVFKGEAAWSVEDINEGKNATDTARTAMDDAGQWLAGQLSEGPKLVDEVRQSFDQLGSKPGFSWSTVERAKKKLGVQTRKDGFGGKSTWAMPGVDEIDEIDEIDEYGDSFSSKNPHSRHNHQKKYGGGTDENGPDGKSHSRQAASFSSARLRKPEEIYPSLATV